MLNMHEEILSEKQKQLLPLVGKFSNRFGLVGGTAIALQIGHRRSIDFDLITLGNLDNEGIRSQVRSYSHIDSIIVDEVGELSLIADSVKLSFIKYPFSIRFNVMFKNYIKMPDLLTLASMKVYALGRRARWKDYVDLYFVLKKYSLGELVKKADEIFKKEFNEKLFREELSYFEDIDHTEKVDYLKGQEINNEEIQKFLIEISLQKV